MSPATRRAFAQGLVAGLVAYAAVALFFLVLNLLQGLHPLHTPALMGAALFEGLRSADALTVRAAPVIAYNGVHLTASLLVGTLASWLVHEAEDHHGLWYAVFFTFLAGFIYAVVVLGVLASEVAGVMSWDAIVGATAVAALSIGLYLRAVHPGLVGELASETEPEVEPALATPVGEGR